MVIGNFINIFCFNYISLIVLGEQTIILTLIIYLIIPELYSQCYHCCCYLFFLEKVLNPSDCCLLLGNVSFMCTFVLHPFITFTLLPLWIAAFWFEHLSQVLLVIVALSLCWFCLFYVVLTGWKEYVSTWLRKDLCLDIFNCNFEYIYNCF